MIWDIPLPRLLSATGGTERRIRPNKVSIDLNITPLSYATIELPTGESLPARGYMELYTSLGSAGIYRVRSPQDAYGDDIATAELEHAIVEVGDWVIQADLDDMMGAGDAMRAVFSHYRGTKWQLGSVDAMGGVQIAVRQRHTRVLEAMLAIMAQVPGCMFAFDFSTTPWTVNVVARDTIVSAEGRLSRNVNSAKIIYDDTELCTRAYYEIPTGAAPDLANFPAFDTNAVNSAGSYVTYDGKLYQLPNGHEYGVPWEDTTKEAAADAPATVWTHMDADTIGTYGIIEREVTTGRDYTLEESERAASEYLRQHKNPRITVEIGGEELSYITGEPLDTFRIGKMFRLALTDYNTTVEQNITGLSWPDVYDTPESIIVNLADEEETAVTYLHDLDAKGGYGGGRGNRDEEVWKEFRTNIEKTDYYLDLWARQYKVTEEILKQAGLYISADGTLIYADDFENAVGAKLRVLNNEISSSVSAASSTIYSTIIQTASSITSRIEDTEQGLYNEILNSASGTRQIIRSTTSRTWIQDKDPTTPAGGSHTPKDGDIWVESTHQGSWDGAEGFPWEHDEEFDWNQIQGAKVWGWANDKWELVSDQQQVVSYAEVVETAEHYLNLRIKGIVNDVGMIEVYISKLEQTAEELRSDIYQSTSQIYSFIDQTVSAINLGVGGRATTVMQKGQPSTIHGRAPVDNDVWIDTEEQETWDKALDFSWNDDYEIEWNKLRSDKIYVYKDGQWVLALDGTVLAEDTDLQIERGHIALLARNIDTLDGYARENFAQLKVEASRISSSVLDKTNQLGSRITQTATQIRSEVYASQSQVYSSITQTASSIRLEVANAISGVQSSITQTASSIRSDVSASQSRIYSSIIQTASSIRLEVKNAISGVNSAITQTASSIRMDVNSAISNVHSAINVQANRIGLVVEGTGANAKIKPASIVAAINNGESSVIISANHINLNGYVKATDITTNYLTTKLESASLIKAGGFQSTGTMYASGTITSGNDVQVTIGSANVSLLNAYTALQVVSAGNNTYKIQRRTFNNSEWQDVPGTFSRAVSSWGFAWGSGYSGMCTITANPQEQSTWVNISQGTSSWSGRTVTIPIMATDANAPGSPTKVYEASATYSLPKSSISLTRSSPSQTEPTADTSVTGIVTNGWYVLTVSAAGTTKTFKLHVTV